MRSAGIVVIGAGGHAAEICSYILALRQGGADVALEGCIDDHKPAGQIGPVNVLGDFAVLERLLASRDHVRCITAVGDNATRRSLVSRVEHLAAGRVEWWTLQHPAALVGTHVEIGAGTCLAPGSIVTTRAAVGRHSILNVHASVSHDASVGEFVSLNPGAVVAGAARLGDGCYIGAGATVIEQITIGAGTIVGAGAVVIEDLPPDVTAVGVPARVIRHNATAWQPRAVAQRA